VIAHLVRRGAGTAPFTTEPIPDAGRYSILMGCQAAADVSERICYA
jgi:hypothetical protein